MFHAYQHLEKYGTTEVERIALGECFIFPKIDGTNASVWIEEGVICAGSRSRQLTLEADNAGFFAWAKVQSNLYNYLKANPTHRLYGEWLVPHSLKTYRETAWRNFYVFDVATEKAPNEILHESDSKLNYLHYDIYKPLLEDHGVNYIPPICKITNADYEQIVNQLIKNCFLIEDGKGCGEGIVIKNYSFRNKYNRTAFAKIVTSEFKEKHAKEMGATEMKGRKKVELEIAQKYVTTALCEKVKAKIELETGDWSSKHIQRLLFTVFYDVVKEDCWEFVKEHKNPTIDFKTLQHFIFSEVKVKMPIVF